MEIEKNILFSDKKLIALCEDGNELGYSLFYQRYSKSIFNSIIRLVTDFSEAEDITQDIFISVFSDIKKLNDIENIEAWLKRVAVNKSISHLRKKKKVYFTDIENTSIVDESENLLTEKQHWDGKVEQIITIIDTLPTETKTIVNLFLFENIPQEEIAQLLGINNTTVRSKYHRAKKKILELLHQKNIS